MRLLFWPGLRLPWLLLLGFLLLIGAIVSLLFSVSLAVPALLSSAGIAILIHDARKRGGWQLVGPHFFYELVQLSRKSRLYSVRVLYMTLILLGLTAVYHGFAFGADFLARMFDTEALFDRNELSRLAESFVFTILTLQTAAVLLLTPVYVAGAIAEEREKHTLELLFTTHLRDREIVLGKLCARVVHLASVLLAALPILSLIQFWGGVEMGVLLAGFANTALMLFSVGSISILISVSSRSVTGAVLTSYALVIPFGLFFFCMAMGFATPIAMLIGRNPGMVVSPTEYLGWVLLGLTLLHGTVIAFALTMAIRTVRMEGPAPVLPYEGARVPTQPAPAPAPVLTACEELDAGPRAVPRQNYDLPPMTDRPLVWKETVLGTGGIGADQILLIMGMVQFLVWMVLGFYDPYFVHGTMVAVTCYIGMKVALRAAGSVVREKQGRTLDSLLIMPVERREILRAKWLGSFLHVRLPFIFWLVLVAASSLVMHPLTGPLLLMVVPVHLAFLASLAILISVNAQTIQRAQYILAVWVLAILAGTWLFELYDPTPWPTWWSSFVSFGLNPVWSWWSVGFPNRFVNRTTPSFIHWSALAAGMALYAAAAWYCWRTAVRDFHSESRPKKTLA